MNYNFDNKKILITGSSGFIGFSLTKELLSNYKNITIIGIDNMNDYYDVKLKESRLNELKKFSNFIFIKESIANKKKVEDIFKKYNPEIVINLAAYAGVRYSIEHPDFYIESNIIGFYNILEACRNFNVKHLIYASSSSVYGLNEKTPYNENDKTDSPVSLYGATKKCNEVIAYSYSKLYNVPTTGLRFFTVYGPYGRPDMAYFSFTKKLLNNEKIKLFNYGNCKRDFTYIDDVVEAIIRIIEKQSNHSNIPYKIYNVGNNETENLLDFVKILEEELIKEELLDKDYDFEKSKELLPMQLGDVYITYADTSLLAKDINFIPNTSLRKGINEFVKWYKNYYRK